MTKDNEPVTRRRFLALGATAAALGLAGCSGSDPDPGPTPTPTGTPEPPCAADVGSSGENSDGDGLYEAGSGSCASIRVKRGVTYHRPSSGGLQLDLYRRDDAADAPGVVLFHGGRWRGGSRSDLESRARRLAEKGFVCACADYRTSDVATYPAAVRDAAAAVQWLRRSGGEFGVDTSRIATYGVSAGAHLATLLAVAPDEPRFQPEGSSGSVSASVRAAVGIGGAYDLRDLASTQSRSAVVEFLGAPPSEAPDRYSEASPVTHVSGDDPSIQLLHGGADEVLPYRQTAQFRNALQESGVEVDVFRADGGGHDFHTTDRFDSEVQVSVRQFLDDAL